MFKIENGREHFFQWDSEQRLIVNSDIITEVHYCNRTDDCSLITAVYEENGVKYSNVPNVLLQTDWPIHIYAVDENYTVYEDVFKVCRRSKPADYIYTETEVKDWETLENYLKTEIQDIKAMVSAIPQFDILVVDTLPTIGVENTIYLVKAEEEENNLYTEYIYINNEWELLGSAKVEIDLTDYVKNTDIATTSKAGLGYATNQHGIMITAAGQYRIVPATDAQIKGKTGYPYAPITPKNLDFAVKHSLTTNTNTLTDADKAVIKNWLGITDSGNSGGIKYYNLALSISPITEGGTNPTIYYGGGQQITVNEGDIVRFNNKLWMFQGASYGGWTQLN